MATGAVFAYAQPYWLQLTVNGFTTSFFWILITFLDLTAEKYYILFVSSWIFPLSLASSLDGYGLEHLYTAQGATIASGVFYFFASIVMIVWTGWDLSSQKTEASVAATADEDIPLPASPLDVRAILGRLKSIRGIIVAAAFFINFVRVIFIQ
jgi:hypothetical protein